MGNKARDQCGSDDFCKDLLENYWRGGGDVTLTTDQFNDITTAAANGKVVGQKTITGANGETLTSKQISFYNTKYAKSLGVATVIYNQQGKAVGFQDGYDFDAKPLGVRPLKRELQTGLVRNFSPSTAKGFKIKYP